GELKRLSLKHVSGYVRQFGTWCDAAIASAYRAAQRCWRGWAVERARVRSLNNDGLIATIQARQRSLARTIGKPRAGWHRTRLVMADEVRQQRRLSMPDKGKRAVTPRKRLRSTPRPARESVPVQTHLIHSWRLSLARRPRVHWRAC